MKKITFTIALLVLVAIAKASNIISISIAEQANSLIFTEIASYEPSNLEWVEIYNAGENDIDLSKLIFFENNTRHSTQLMQGDANLKPHTYAAIVNNYQDFISKHTEITPSETIFDSSWSSLNENGEEIKLELNQIFVDTLTYPSNTLKQSQERLYYNSEYLDTWSHGKTENSLLKENSATIPEENNNDDSNQNSDNQDDNNQDNSSNDLENPPAESEETPNITVETTPSNAFLSEISFKDTTKDWIEIFIPKPDEFAEKTLFIQIDSKKYQVIFDETETNPLLISLEIDLVGTTEQILLLEENEIIDAVCWQNASPATSEIEELTKIRNEYKYLETCMDSDKIEANQSIGKSIFVPKSPSDFWQIYLHPTKLEHNLIKNDPPKAIITIQSGKIIASKETNLNFDGNQSSDPDNDKLSYFWDFGNGTKSDKANPDSVNYNKVGEYLATLKVTDPLNASSTYTLKVIVNDTSTTTSSNTTANTNATKSSTATTQIPKSNSKLSPKIQSFMPNPVGTDTGNEIITIVNSHTESINLMGWQLDDGPEGSKPYAFPNLTLTSNETYEISNELSKISLNNDSDSVRLINPNGEIIETAEYANAKEGDIFIKINDKWEPQQQDDSSTVTLSAENTPTTKTKTAGTTTTISQKNGTSNPNLRITEIMPNPKGTDSGAEWIEIYNPTSNQTPLENWTLKINTKTFNFTNEIVPPNSFTKIIINKGSLPNESAELFLLDFKENLIDHIKYDKSQEGKSYSLINNEFTWTDNLTPGAQNPQIIKLAGKLIDIQSETQTFKIVNDANKEIEVFYTEKININPNSYLELEVFENEDKYILYKILTMRLLEADTGDNKKTPIIPLTFTTASLGTGFAFRKKLIELVKNFNM